MKATTSTNKRSLDSIYATNAKALAKKDKQPGPASEVNNARRISGNNEKKQYQ
jgi:hypothetical protein